MRDAPRKMVILTDGHMNPHTAKTAISLIRYRPAEVAAVLDHQELVGVGGHPVVATLAEAPNNTLLIGIVLPGQDSESLAGIRSKRLAGDERRFGPADLLKDDAVAPCRRSSSTSETTTRPTFGGFR